MQKGNNQQKQVDSPGSGNQLNRIMKAGLTGIIALQCIAMTLLSWKVYDPEAWLPMPHWSTFFVGSLCLTLFGIMFVQMCRTTSN